MGKYGEVALKVTKKIKGKEEYDIYTLWREAATEVFEKNSSINKGCPRSSYIGLCEDGKVKGIKAGKYSKGSSIKNKSYALEAVKLLKKDSKLSDIDEKELWKRVVQDKTYNQQMDVVLTLWKKGFIE